MNLSQITSTNLQITSQRLAMNLMTEHDWPEFNLLQSDEKLMANIGPVLSEAEVREKFIDRIKPFNKETGHWVTLIMRDKFTNEFIGSIGFKFQSIEDERTEIGYLVIQKFNGQGYVTEAGKALLSFLLKQVNVRKVVANCTTTNIGSWRVMEKLGLQREGCLLSDFYLNGMWHDSYCYGLVHLD